MNSSGPSSRTHRSSINILVGLACLAVLGLGCVVRFWKLGNLDFWFDEGLTFIVVNQFWDWPTESRLLSEVTNVPYYAILSWWIGIVGDAPLGLRSLSAVCGLLTVPLFALVSNRFRGLSAVIVGGGLAALHPLHVHYSREARVYAFWIFCMTATLALLSEAARRMAWRWWLAFGALLFFTLHVHYWTLYWIPASAAAIFISPNRGAALWRWLITATGAGIAFIPFMILAVIPASQGGISAWLDDRFSPWKAVPLSLWALLPAGAYPPYLRELSAAFPEEIISQPRWLIMASEAIPLVILTLLCIFIMFRRKHLLRNHPVSSLHANPMNARTFEPPFRTTPPGIFADHAFAACVTLIPLLLAMIYSVAVRPVYLVARYDVVAWPGTMLWITLILCDAGRGLAKRRGMIVIGVATTILAACSAVPLSRLLGGEYAPSFSRLRAEKLAALVNERDLVIAYSYDRDYLQYELHRLAFRGELRSFPPWLEGQIGWVDTQRDLMPDRKTMLPQAASKLASIALERTANKARVYVLGDSTDRDASGLRSPINRALTDEFARRGCRLSLSNPEVGIYELICTR